jgi:putative tryptophan/tyrosine transport system substrate-binding protein
MKRRKFIGLLGGAAASWPLAARTQQTRMPAIGFLRSASSAPSQFLASAFREGLKEQGFVEGQNVQIEYRYADDEKERLRNLATDLLARPLAVIVADTIAAIQIKAAATTVPLIFASGGDPVVAGLVTSLNRPGGNVTGVVFFATLLGAKRLELLRRAVPNAAMIGVLTSRTSPNVEAERGDVESAALAVGQQLTVVDVYREVELDTAFVTFIRSGARALLIGSGTLLTTNRARIIALAARHALPAIYPHREAALDGGMMSYGASVADAYRQAGIYAGRILKGEKAADLPVMRSSKFEFVLNLGTAKALGIDIPPMLLALADEVIE